LELRALARLHPQRNPYCTPAYWCFVIVYRVVWFSTIIYWQVRILICPPRFLKRGQDESHGTFQMYYIFLSILLFVDIFLLEGTRIHVFKVDRGCFYYILRLGIIVYSDKGLWIRSPLYIVCWHDLATPVGLSQHFDFTRRVFIVVQSSGAFRYRFYLRGVQTRPAKSCSYLVCMS